MNVALEMIFLIIIAMGIITCSYAQSQETAKRENHPKSCLDHLRSGDSTCGIFKIYDDAGNGYPVYCDMKSEAGMAWTLVMSWSMKNRALSQFRSAAFKSNVPVNENSPNWNMYRQTLTRMKSLKSHSTHWRATCSYSTYGVDYTDYVRANFKDFDIMTFRGSGTCKKVELVNIRGHLGIQLTSRWWQISGRYAPHIDSSSRGCQFVPVSGAKSSEDSFGYYHTINPTFRCTASPTSSTQWWFGGYL